MAGKIYNTVFIKDGRIVQLDDVISQNNQPPEPGPVPPGPVPPGPVPPGPTPPGPTPPGPTPPGPTPGPVEVSVTIAGNVLTITATGEVESIAGYKVNVYNGNTLVKSYDVDTTGIFDMSQATADLPIGKYTIKAVAYDDEGATLSESAGVAWTRNPDTRNIWIKFKFSDATYNPQEKQLAVGKAITGEDKYGNANKKFSADWQRDPGSEGNVWIWGVTEGTNLSSAFVYGDGTNTGVPMLSGEDYITGIPEELTLVEGDTREKLMEDADTWKYGIIDPEDWVPECQILDWDLENATDITAIIGTNVWFKNNLVGTLPALRSNSIGNIGYAFDRCWNVTSMGPINLPNCSTGANNAFMSMMGLTEIPTIEAYHATSQLNNTFNGCLHASKESIEDAFETLSSGSHTDTGNCFGKCGKQEDPTALENIPVSWGGEAIILGTNVNGNITPLAAGGQIIKF